MQCPKCGRAVDDEAFICPGCDFILDASFLGDDITDDEREKRLKRAPSRKADAPDFGADAMILGQVNADEVSSFQSRDAGLSQREVTHARFYVGGAVAQLMNPSAIPEVASTPGESMRITPFERHVLGFVNGRRSVGRIQKKAAIEDSEFKTALALLADKGFVRLKGYKKEKQPRSNSLPSGRAANSLPAARGTQSGASGPPAADALTRGVLGEEQTSAGTFATPNTMAHSQHATVVASMEQIESLARNSQALRSRLQPPEGESESDPRSSSKSSGSRSSSRQSASSFSRPLIEDDAPSLDTPVDPRPMPLTVGGPASLITRAVGDRFSSLNDAPDEDWGKADSSLVFARDAAPLPSLVERPANEFEADGFDNGDGPTIARGTLSSALKDPTGLGDSPLSEPAAADGAPLQSDAIASSDASIAFADDEDSVSLDPLAQRGLDEVPGRRHGTPAPLAVADLASLPTGPAPSNAPVQEPDDPATPTALVPAQGPFTLPSDALMALPEPVQIPAPSVPPPLPRPLPLPPLPLPGQALVTSALPPRPNAVPTLVQPAQTALPRPSAMSSVPFELRKKAERIYEQALKDQAEDRTASALMNAKLAMNFDPSVPAYKELFEELGLAQKGKPRVKGPPAREFVLHEQASEAEGRGDYLKAVKLLEEAIAVNPRAAALYNRLGVVLSIRLKRHDEALAHLKTAIELEPGSIVYMNNFSKVTGLLESVLEKDPHARRTRGEPKPIKVRPKF